MSLELHISLNIDWRKTLDVMSGVSPNGSSNATPLARALMGDRDGAIADWQYFVEQSRENAVLTNQRQEWIELLRSGGKFVLTDQLRKRLLAQ